MTVQINVHRTVVITGASAGVGRAVAREFASHGFRVGLIARGAEGLQGAARDVHQAGAEALVLPADVADAQALFDASDRVASTWGSIDVWINCAMVTVYSRVHEMTPAEYRRVTEVTYLGYVHGTLAALRHMRGSARGTIVQVGSALAHRAIPLQSAYCAAKFAVRGFTDALRSELIDEKSGVRLTMVQLPAVNTPQFDWARSRLPERPQPVPPIFQPEVAARAIYRAAMRAPRELWLGRSTVAAILGNMLAPGWLDRLLARTAIKGQMSGEPVPGAPPDNLFDPVAGDFGAHGRFDHRASSRSIGISSTAVRGSLAALLVVLCASALAYWVTRGLAS